MEQPIEQRYQEQMRELGRAIDKILNGDKFASKTGFCLLMFSFDNKPDDRMNYICNAKRETMIEAMKEFIGNAEGCNKSVIVKGQH